MSAEKDFQARLRFLRSKSGASQKHVAESLGLSEVGYRNYEIGRRKPTFEILTLLADFFNVSIDYLVGRSSTPARLP